jgi:hypothetical protein
MLNLSQLYVVDKGRLKGIITKQEFLIQKDLKGQVSTSKNTSNVLQMEELINSKSAIKEI